MQYFIYTKLSFQYRTEIKELLLINQYDLEIDLLGFNQFS